jgi:Zn finger protein HypA/HybF involved in hydrogenase expression
MYTWYSYAQRIRFEWGGSMTESYSGEAYCVKCKEKRPFDGHVEEKNGRRFAKGICPTCGTKVTRILGKA